MSDLSILLAWSRSRQIPTFGEIALNQNPQQGADELRVHSAGGSTSSSPEKSLPPIMARTPPENSIGHVSLGHHIVTRRASVAIKDPELKIINAVVRFETDLLKLLNTTASEANEDLIDRSQFHQVMGKDRFFQNQNPDEICTQNLAYTTYLLKSFKLLEQSAELTPEELLGLDLQKLLKPGKVYNRDLATEIIWIFSRQKLAHDQIHQCKSEKSEILGIQGPLLFIPPALFELTHLKVLSLKSLSLKECPDEIGKLVNLEKLDLGHNEFESVSPEIGKLKNLVELHINYCEHLAELPAELMHLINLRALYVNNNRLFKIPSGIQFLTELVVLDLGSNYLSNLPKEFGHLTKLERLILNNNKLTKIGPWIRGMTRLTALQARSNQITDLHEGLQFCSAIIELDLSHNKLQKMIQLHSPHMVKLNLSHNQFVKLGCCFDKLFALQDLNLSSNFIEDVAPYFNCINRIHRLDLSSNKLSLLPLTLSNLRELRILILDNNYIKEVPTELIYLAGSLEILSLRGNQLQEFPLVIYNLTKLKSLYLDKNQIAEISTALNNLKQLKMLSIYRNPLEALPYGVIKGLNTVLRVDHKQNESFEKEQAYLDLCARLNGCMVEVDLILDQSAG